MSIKINVILLSVLLSGQIFAVTPHKSTSCDFVIKKSEKKASKSKLQEDTCAIFGDQISSIADTNQKVSNIQKILLEHTCKYLESSSDCIILKSDKKKADEILRVAKNFEDKMQDFIQDCDKYLEYLKNIK